RLMAWGSASGGCASYILLWIGTILISITIGIEFSGNREPYTATRPAAAACDRCSGPMRNVPGSHDWEDRRVFRWAAAGNRGSDPGGVPGGFAVAGVVGTVRVRRDGAAVCRWRAGPGCAERAQRG